MNRASCQFLNYYHKPGAWIAVFSASIVIVICNQWSQQYFHNVCDDSLISMQYAKNLALGNGVVFNIGERVEGYTNFLWIVLLAPLFLLCQHVSLDFIRVAVQVSIIFAAIDLLLVYLVGRLLWKDRYLPLVVAMGICLADNSYTVWAIQALESHFVIFWMLLAILLWQKERFAGLGITLACLVMSRPDAGIFVSVLLGAEIIEIGWKFFRHKQDPHRDHCEVRLALRGLIKTLFVFLFIFSIYFVWRYKYYGYLFPNTYYLKASGLYLEATQRGIDYLQGFLDQRGWIPLVSVFGILRIGDRVVRRLFFFLLLHIMYIIYIGGDFYPGHRFFVVTIPIIGLLLGNLVDFGVKLWWTRNFNSSTQHKPWVYRSVNTGFLFLILSGLAYMAHVGIVHGPYQTEIVRFGQQIEETYGFVTWLGRRSQKRSSILTGDIGSSGFLGGFHVYDYYGVIDPITAHMGVSSFGSGKPGHEKRADTDRLLQKRPTYIKIGYVRRDLSVLGYYLSDSGPNGRCGPGIWVADELTEVSHWKREMSIHFGVRPPNNWQVYGNAFHYWAARGTRPHQQRVLGATGIYLSTFHPQHGDNAVGWVRSAPISLVGDRMVLRIGGGRNQEQLRVSLLIDGVRHFSETGCNRELLSRRTWDISNFRGKSAILEVVDQVRGPWGHIMLDEVSQWSSL